MLRVLALIPARAGSKGLRHKNVRVVAGATLLARAVGLAHASARRGELWTVVVSTDSRRYAALARRAGALTPFLRPRALAMDDARLSAVVLHALETLAALGQVFDAVVLLTPTTPLTRPADVRAALGIWRRSGGRAVISVVADRVAPSWRFAEVGGRLSAPGRRRVGRRQEGPRALVLNGAVYVATPLWLRRHRQFFVSGETLPYTMPPSRSLDIEDAHDLRVAGLLLAASGGAPGRHARGERPHAGRGVDQRSSGASSSRGGSSR